MPEPEKPAPPTPPPPAGLDCVEAETVPALSCVDVAVQPQHVEAVEAAEVVQVPMATVVARSVPGRGHQRSVSHGGQHLAHLIRPQEDVLPPMPPPALKKPALKGHRRVFSHGQIPFSKDGTLGLEAADMTSETTDSYQKGHKRSGSKTDFILPPGHEERERKRSVAGGGLQRSGSRLGSAGPRGPSAGHRRQASRSDSLGISFRGHSRQASRTDSIYTLRQTTTNYKRKIFSFGRKKVDAETKHRTVVPNHIVPSDTSLSDHPNHAYLDNYVSTTKYTVLSFLPKNLFEQFHRFANLYFLFIVLLNWVPAINAFGKEISMMPVIFVLGVTAIKDIFEDRRRYISDKRVNNSSCRVYQTSSQRYVKCLWKDLKVGDIVHLSCDEMIPADILVLRSSDRHGLCYIDTQNLDGEANLKQREVPRGFVENQETFNPQNFRSTLECDMPTTKIYRFHGSIIHPWGERVPVTKDNLLLRECILKNTNFIEGLVVYAGHESKAMLNNGGPRYKRSKLERQMNLEVIWCVVILIVLCFIGAVGSGLWLSKFETYVPFLNTLDISNTNPAYEGFLTFWTFVIILQVIIPLSLYVTIEMTKLLQVYLIHQDIDMYDDKLGVSVECRALNIPEELGQIQYMFCDKTGTLTENNMIFKRCTIDGVDFDHNSFSTLVKNDKGGQRKSTVIPVNSRLVERLSSEADQRYLLDTETKTFKHESQKINDFFLLLAVCNTVIVAKKPHVDHMNASGIICPPSASKSNSSQLGDTPEYGSLESQRPVPHVLEQVPEEPLNSAQSTSVESVATTAPLRPDPSLTPKRPTRLMGFLPAKPSLSPIAASPDVTPTSENKSKHLALPNLLTPLSKLVSYNSISSLTKHLAGGSRASTPPLANVGGDSKKPLYEAESPDELALVDAAFAYNCQLLRRTPYEISVSTPSQGVVDYQVLHVLPFDSVRKRMSVILMHPQTQERILFCKGADSAMFPKLEPPANHKESEILERTQHHLNSYATLGLRVLVMAKRVLTDADYRDWVIDHEEAENSLQRREKLLADSYSRIECRMQLLGTTAIEDKLQEGVPETIRNLRRAGIVVWVLTGDKQETAINIAFSCKLFSDDMKIITLNAKSRDAAEATMKVHLDEIQQLEDGLNHSKTSAMYKNSGETEKLSKETKRALVVDGKTLIYILDKRAKLQDTFLKLTSHCSSVLCCRATPLQKAYIVRIVKEELKMHTLAIGDGANDVSMIQTADVGVGISGQEGRQAVMASDFAISRFKFIERLLLVHGHWNYDRLARMVLYFFYKNAAFVFVCFWYQLFCGFSGAVMIDQMYLMLYNLLFTSLPPMAIGVFDQDLQDVVLMTHPYLYKQGRLGEVYKPYSFWINMADALYQSIVIFFVSFGAYFGSDVGIWEFGTVMCTQCLIAMSLHLAIETRSWTIVHWSSVILSILFYFVFALIYNGVCIDCFGLNVPFWVMQHAMNTVQFWIITLLSSVMAVLPRIFLKTWHNMLFPTDVSKVIMARNRVGSKQSSSLFKNGNQCSDIEMIPA